MYATDFYESGTSVARKKQFCSRNTFGYKAEVALSDTQKRISLAIKAKRRKVRLGVRAAAKECGIDASTLSRLERGAYSTLPDASTLSKLCAWLGTSIDALLGPEDLDLKPTTMENTTPEIVEVHLRADKNLS